MIGSGIIHRLAALLKKDSVFYNNMILPAPHLRFCGKDFKDDRHFFDSAQIEADRLVRFCGLNATSHVLEVGCGPGRLPIGILSRFGEIAYYSGFDVDARSIKWCKRQVASRHPTFQFTHIDVSNSRYNPRGKTIDSTFRLPTRDKEFDIIYLYSVFSHMNEEDIRAYLKEFQRLLSPMGKVFFTDFIEAGVPEMTINPHGYRMDWQGPLHCVRYSKEHFKSLLDESNFNIDRFEYETETDGQSAVYVSRKKSPD